MAWVRESANAEGMTIETKSPTGWQRTGHFGWVITSDESGTTGENSFTITFTFDESVADFDLSDCFTSNCVLSSLAGSGKVYTATCTPSSLGKVDVAVLYGLVTDIYGNKNSTGVPFTITRIFGNNYSLLLDGTNYVNLSVDFGVWGDDTVSFTLSAWLKSTTDSAMHIISTHSDDDAIRMQFSYSGTLNRLSLYLLEGGNSATVKNGVNPTDGDWHHAVVVVTRASTDTAQWYIDGSTSTGNSTDISAITGDLSGGDLTTKLGAAGKSGGYWNGNLTDIAMWNTALTADDVSKIYNSGVPTDLTSADSYDSGDLTGNLRGYWPFEEGSGILISDSSSSNETGTLINPAGTTWSTDVPS